MIENEEELARLQYENKIMRGVLLQIASFEQYLCTLPADPHKTMRVHAALGLSVALAKEIFDDLIASEED